MNIKETIGWIAFVLLVIGGLNWGCVAFGFNPVELVFSAIPYAVQAIYILVALAAIYKIYAKFTK